MPVLTFLAYWKYDIFHYIGQIDALAAEGLYHKTNILPATAAACDSFGVSAQELGYQKKKVTNNVDFRLLLKVVGSNQSAV